ncbi:hypothetical protein BDR22DRAFT_385247 [Usnea florida]
MSLNPRSAEGDIHADQRGRIIGSHTATIALTFVFVFLRLLSRKLSRAGYWWDDLLAVIAAIFATICCVTNLIALHYGFGRHISSFSRPVGNERAFLRHLFIFEIFFNMAVLISKLSVLAFYYRIFPIFRFRRLVLWVALLSVVFILASLLVITFQCRPIHYAWDRVDGNIQGHCLNIEDYFVSSGSCNVAINLLIFILVRHDNSPTLLSCLTER